jgi:menaquinone-dependent protoporphyrinogen oxidase
MKTLIIFSSTYGYAKECAEKLKEKLRGEHFLVNAMSEVIPPIDQFDNIIVGGSIYMGHIHTNIKTYCNSNVGFLKNKRIGLFLCCGLVEDFEQSMNNAFPEELLKNAVAKECFGGELRMDKMKFVHKIITGIMKKAVAKEGKELPKPMPENIVKLADAINIGNY